MRNILAKYHKKLIDSGLSKAEDILIGGLDAEIVWNKDIHSIGT